jgi:hypothetical protein
VAKVDRRIVGEFDTHQRRDEISTEKEKNRDAQAPGHQALQAAMRNEYQHETERPQTVERRNMFDRYPHALPMGCIEACGEKYGTNALRRFFI